MQNKKSKLTEILEIIQGIYLIAKAKLEKFEKGDKEDVTIKLLEVLDVLMTAGHIAAGIVGFAIITGIMSEALFMANTDLILLLMMVGICRMISKKPLMNQIKELQKEKARKEKIKLLR